MKAYKLLYRETLSDVIDIDVLVNFDGRGEILRNNNVIGHGIWDLLTGFCLDAYVVAGMVNFLIPPTPKNLRLDLDYKLTKPSCDCGYESIKDLGSLAVHYDWCSINKKVG